ncbi:MAG: T9SS type A sorting domain-containing protein [Cyclobacteriaceae bacterium]
MPSDSRLEIASTFSTSVSIYVNSCDNESYEGGSYSGNILITTLKAGDEVFIRWATKDKSGFDWNLSLPNPEVGDNCDLAVDANSGANTIPPTDYQYPYWYKYIMPSDGSLQIYGKDGTIDMYSSICDNLQLEKSSNRRSYITVNTLNKGDEVYIKWNRYHTNSIDWSLAVMPIGTGSNCTSADTAEIGTNWFVSDKDYWYTYTMPDDGELEITLDEYAFIYLNSCYNLIYEGYADYLEDSLSLSKGDQLFIKWDPSSSYERLFDWQLEFIPLTPGGRCIRADTAITGTNTIPEGPSSYYWYTYTMPSNGKLQMTATTPGSEYVEIYRGNCDNLTLLEDDDQKTVALQEGDQVFIRWGNINDKGLEWNLSLLPLEDGDLCSLAVPATEGTNTLPATNNSLYWYTYTMPTDGKLHVSSEQADFVTMYRSNCDDLSPLEDAYGEGNASATKLIKGEKIFIRWNVDNGNSFEWNLWTSPPGAGDNCDQAVAATVGLNIIPPTRNPLYWYTYTMPSDGKLQMITTALGSEYAEVYRGDCDNLTLLEDDYQKTVALQKGDQVFIRWGNINDKGLEWDLSLLPLEDGDLCSLAVPATKGINTLPVTNNSLYWYTYTMPTDGKLEVSSSQIDYVTLFKGGCGNLQYVEYANGEGKATATTLKQGDTVFIQWMIYRNGNFDWEISVNPLEDGDRCDIPKAATVGNNTIPPTQNPFQWYTYTMPIDGKLKIIPEEATYIRVYDNTCENLNLKGENFGGIKVNDLNQGDELIIQIRTDLNDSYNFVGDFDWELSALTVEPGDACSIPETAKIGTNTTIITPHWFEYTVPVTGNYTISSTEVSVNFSKVYSNCSGVIIDENEETQPSHEKSSYALKAGDHIYILWNDVNISFEWELSADVPITQKPPENIAAAYPNPSLDGTLLIDVVPNSDVKSVTFYNSLGIEMATNNLTSGENQINTDGLKAGIYLLKFNNGSSQRVIIR